MKTIMLICSIGILTVMSTMAQADSASVPTPPAPAMSSTDSTKVTISGTIIDNACATANQDTLAAFIKTHTKECALMPNCQASGYSIYTKDGKLQHFLQQNSKTIIDFLKIKKNTLHVMVTADVVGDSLDLVTIKAAHKMGKSMKKAM